MKVNEIINQVLIKLLANNENNLQEFAGCNNIATSLVEKGEIYSTTDSRNIKYGELQKHITIEDTEHEGVVIIKFDKPSACKEKIVHDKMDELADKKFDEIQELKQKLESLRSEYNIIIEVHELLYK